MANWKRVVTAALEKNGKTPVFNEPANLNNLLECEEDLGISLPEDLRDLLIQTNGIKYQSNMDGDWAIYSIEEILRWTMIHRGLSPSEALESVIFFADSGAEESFVFDLRETNVNGQVCVWYPSEKTLRPLHLNLKEFLNKWYSGRLNI